MSSDERRSADSRAVYYFTDSRALGGAEEALLILIENIDRRVWRPTLLYNASPAIATLVSRARDLGAETRAVPALPLGLAGARRLSSFARELRQARPAVFHAHLSWPLAAKYALFAAVFARVPAVVATVHLFPEFHLDRSNYVQERLLAARVGRYIAVSHDIAVKLVKALHWPARKIEVIHNGIAVERFQRRFGTDLRMRLKVPANRPVFLTVARFDRQKGHDVLLQAATRIPEACFVLAGDGPERMRLERQVEQLRLRDRVLFLGRRTDVPELLAASDAFVLPSLYEGSSLALLEAMAAGKPVVTSAIPGTDELILDGETGLLVPPGNPDALALALRRVLAEPLLRARLGTAARDHAQRSFSASAAASRVAAVYDELLRKAESDGRR